MNFVSYEFLVFFLIVSLLYYLLSHRLQNLMLLVASYVFYACWDPRFLTLLLISSIVDYCCGLIVDRHRRPDTSERKRKLAIAISVSTNLGILGFFKYCDFFIESFLALGSLVDLNLDLATLNIILPVGISFYTFQTMSYTIDVYRGQLRATNRLFDFMLYVGFFPQLVAGPIERGVHLLPQVLAPRRQGLDALCSGAQLALWGFFKKMVIADNMALIVDDVFGGVGVCGVTYVLGVYAFALQIYCDFSGYTDIARGAARMLGFNICVNFRLPYFAVSPSDFWQRWHISLSSWLRDYLYIPLGGNRLGRSKILRNLMITMVLGGLWHGASWHFVIWGVYHGFLLIAYHFLAPAPKARDVARPIRNWVGRWFSAILFFHFTCVGWLIFRVDDMGQLVHIVQKMVTQTSLVLTAASTDGLPVTMLLKFVVLSAPLFLVQLYQHCLDDMEPWTRWPIYIRVSFYLALFYSIVMVGTPVHETFIYFQF